MKKSIVIIFTVAILGVMGMYINKSPSASGTSAPSANKAGNNAQTALGSNSGNTSSKTYKDGTYTGSAADTPYGTVQMAAIISGGKIVDVNFLQMPNDQGHSREVTAYAEPLLKQVTLNAQSSNIDFVSGATSTSIGYQESLQAALNKAVQTGQNSSSNTNSSTGSAPNAGQSVPPFSGSDSRSDE